jgi:hypothetical protein
MMLLLCSMSCSGWGDKCIGCSDCQPELVNKFLAQSGAPPGGVLPPAPSSTPLPSRVEEVKASPGALGRARALAVTNDRIVKWYEGIQKQVVASITKASEEALFAADFNFDVLPIQTKVPTKELMDDTVKKLIADKTNVGIANCKWNYKSPTILSLAFSW